MVHRSRTDARQFCRRSRRVLVALSVAALVATVGEYLAPANAQLWWADVAWTLSGVVAVGGVAAARRRVGPSGRGGWTLLLWGCVAWLVGCLLWSLYGVAGFPASPNGADFCWLAFAVLAALAVHRLGPGRAAASRTWFEVAPLVVAVSALLSALLWNQIGGSDLAVPAAVTAVAYPIFYVSTALVMLQAVVSGALDVRANRGLAAVLVGLVLEALAFILWSPLLLKGTYVAGTNVVDALWAVGMLLVGFGALSAGPPRAVAEVELVSERRGGALSALTLVVLAVAQALEILSDAVAGVELALGVGMAVVGATLIARASMLRAQQIVLFDRLRERERELEEANRRLSEESRRDPLTGLANRLRLREDLIELAARSERYGETYCLVLCDLDRFKDYNDELGHQAGDHALRAVAALLESHTRGGDCAYRYGGEELLIVLHGQDGDSGAAIAERHRANVEAAALPHPANPPTDVVTFSAGVAAAQPGETPAEVLLRADRALYRAKAAGRNRTAIAGPDQPLGPAALSSLT
jgi:diguanylate cyclase (GGDEF)-like protein